MTEISTAGLNIKRLMDLPASAIRKATAEEIAVGEEMFAAQFRVPVGKADNHPDNIYATVKLNGKVVATLYNSGLSVTPNNLPVILENLPGFGPNEAGAGPQLAQKRAEAIAKAVGGTIEKAPTALEPGQWKPQPAQWTYDYKAMAAARAAQDALNAAAAAGVQAQMMAQTGEA